jgi:hypothetical protein
MKLIKIQKIKVKTGHLTLLIYKSTVTMVRKILIGGKKCLNTYYLIWMEQSLIPEWESQKQCNIH